MSHAAAQADRLTAGQALERAILDRLATYQLMTARLLIEAGAGHDLRRVREAAAKLTRDKRIACRTAREIGHPGVRDAVYWLKPRGAVALAPEGPDIPTSRRDPKFRNELEHRLDIVRCHIALRQCAASAGVRDVRVVQDFDAGSPARRKATTTDLRGVGRPFLPDALAIVTLADGAARLLVLEVERGGFDGDLYAFRRHKLPHLAAVLAAGDELAAVYGVSGPPLILVVFQHAKMRDRALKLWQGAQAEQFLVPAAPLWDTLFIKALPEVQADFAVGWWQPGDRPRRPLFSAGPAAA